MVLLDGSWLAGLLITKLIKSVLRCVGRSRAKKIAVALPQKERELKQSQVQAVAACVCRQIPLHTATTLFRFTVRPRGAQRQLLSADLSAAHLTTPLPWWENLQPGRRRVREAGAPCLFKIHVHLRL